MVFHYSYGHFKKRMDCIFSVQAGCGVNGKSYAAAYAKNFKKLAIGCAVILGGHTAINCLMEL
ncbi:hypothetical protein N8131_00400 [Flavobacteriaceae bacterium]|nr:hypothetical protein [Flavobacteriaceae bacterium]